jgi:YceI-like protein
VTTPRVRKTVMPSPADHETRTPTPETRPKLAGRWRIDPQASHARFVARTLAGLVKTPGRFRSLSGHLVVDGAHAAGALVIDSSSIDTGNRIRDRHLRSRDFFDVERHPALRYEMRSISGTRIDGELVQPVSVNRSPMSSLSARRARRPPGLAGAGGLRRELRAETGRSGGGGLVRRR